MHLQARVFWGWSQLHRWKQYLGLLYNESFSNQLHLSRLKAKFSHKVVCSFVSSAAVGSFKLDNKCRNALARCYSLWFAVSVFDFSLIHAWDIYVFWCIIILCPYKIVMSAHAYTLSELPTFNHIRLVSHNSVFRESAETFLFCSSFCWHFFFRVEVILHSCFLRFR